MSELLLPLPGTNSRPTREAVGVNHVALILVLAIGFVLGMLPPWFMAGRPTTALYASAVVLVATVYIVAKVKAPRATTRPPTLGDLALATAAATFVPSAFGLFWATCHLGLGAIGWSLNRFVGWPAGASPFGETARLSGLFLAPIQVGGVIVTLQNLLGQLYPDRAGLRSVFQEVRRSKSWHWFAIAAVAPGFVLAVAFVAGWPVSSGWAALLVIVEILGGAQLFSLNTASRQPSEQEAASAIEGLLQAVGYQVIRAPRAGLDEIDPLLADLALYARSSDGSQGLAIDVVSASVDKPVSWTAGMNLQLMTLALKQTQEDSRQIFPVLVVLGDGLEHQLRDYAHQHSICVVEGLDASIIAEGLRRPLELTDHASAFTKRLTSPVSTSSPSASPGMGS